jgi:hypothetical protein
MAMLFRSLMRWVELLTFKLYGRGSWVLSFLMSSWASLYAAAFFQLTIGLMGCSVLCNFNRPLMEGGEGLVEIDD